MNPHIKKFLMAAIFSVPCFYSQAHAQQTAGSAAKAPEPKSEAPAGLVLEISATRDEYSVKEPIELQARLKNTSKTDLNVVQSDNTYGLVGGPPTPRGGFLVTVKDSRGQSVPYTRFGKHFMGADWPFDVGNPSQEMFRRFSAPIVLKSGQAVEERLPLNRLVDLSRGGTYFVTATRRVFTAGNAGFANVVSNTIQIKAIEPEEVVWAPLRSGALPLEEDAPKPNFKWDKPVTSLWRHGHSWLLDVEMYHTNIIGVPATQVADLKRALEKSNVSKEVADSILRQAQETPPGELPYAVQRWKVQVQVKNMTLAERDVWSVTFRPSLLHAYSEPLVWRILVDKETGQTIEAAHYPNLGIARTRRFAIEKPQGQAQGSEIAFASPQDSDGESPIEIFPLHLAAPLEALSKNYGERLFLSTQDTPRGRLATARVEWKHREQTLTRTITQRWVPGAPWWSEYELSDPNRHIILRAKRVRPELEVVQPE